jgi:phage tail-like protein
MAVERPERPYNQFNFRVTIADVLPDGGDVKAGFQEVSGIGMEVAVAEYRNGNDKVNNVRKIVGLAKTSDITLKRGVIGTLDLYRWLDSLRNGDTNSAKSVKIELLAEDRSGPVLSWRLTNARIIKHTSGPMNAKGNDVAIEEMVLSSERFEME